MTIVQKKGLALAASLAVGLAMAGGSTAYKDKMVWHNQTGWLGGIPADGSTAVISNSVKSMVATNLARRIVLNRLEVPGSAGSLRLSGGDPIEFVGEATVDMPNDVAAGSRDVSHMCVIESPVVVEAGNSLTLSGGWWHQLASLSGAGTLKVRDGALLMTNTIETLHVGDLELCGGGFLYRPTQVSGGTASTSVAGSLKAVATGSGIELDKGTGASTAVSFGKLELADAATLAIAAASGFPGGVEKVRVADASSVPVLDGVVDARIVVADQSAATGFRMAFATYDETDGFRPYETTKTLDEAGEDDIAVVKTATTLAADVHVRGLVIEASAALTVPAGVTLTVGDGVHPAAIIVNRKPNSANRQDYTISGDGTIAFGTAPGLFYTCIAHQLSALVINPRVTGSAGVSFVGNAVADGQGGSISFPARAAEWSGPTRFAGARANAEKGVSPFPPGGDVYIDGGKSLFSSALIISAKTCSFDQHLHLAGTGSKGASGPGSVYLNYANLTLNGPVTLEREASVEANDDARTVTYNGPIDGPGGLILNKGKHFFNATNVFCGVTRFNGSTVSTFSGDATTGTGGFEVAPSASVTFCNSTNAMSVIAGDYRNAGRLLFENGAWQLPGSGVAMRLEMHGARLAVANLRVETIANPDWKLDAIEAISPFGALTFAGTGNVRVPVKLRDGDGRLSLVKTGPGTLTISGTQEYTGRTVVEEGTLRVTTSVLDDARISWWLDASDASTVVTNASGMVTEWRSKVGDIVFTPAKYSTNPQPGPYYTNTVNGLKAMSFDDVTRNRLCGSDTSCQRTVFIVNRPRELAQYRGLYGLNGDTGIRVDKVDASGHACSWGFVSSETGIGDGYSFRVNGKDRSIANGVANVVSFTKGYDGLSNYVPYLGGYYPWSEGGGFGARNFRGEICEAIAFNRVLSDSERSEVERYLAKKWGIELRAETPADEKGPVLNAATDLVIAEGATLDLRGVTQTVASLNGAGTIVNTSTQPATLTVSGACAFCGKVRGDVKLVAATGGSLALDMAEAGSLAIGGSATVVCRDFAMPTNGLALWLDASRPESIESNKTGKVTGWLSRAGRVGKVINNMGLSWKPAYYTAGGEYYGTDPDGKPAVHFASSNALAAANCSPRTVFFVARLEASGLSDRQVPWGIYKNPVAIDYRTGSSSFAYTDYWGDLASVGTVLLNDSTDWKCSPGSRYILTSRILDDYGSAALGSAGGTSDGAGITIGANYNDGLPEWVHEVIVFERNVSDAEYRAIYDYLKEKWIDSPAGTVGGVTTQALADGVTVEMTGASRLDLSAAGSVSLASLASDGAGGSIVGDFTLAGSFTVDAADAPTLTPLVVDGDLTLVGATVDVLNYGKLSRKVQEHAVLSVTGEVTDDFVNEPKLSRWLWMRTGNVWKMIRPGLLIVIK